MERKHSKEETNRPYHPLLAFITTTDTATIYFHLNPLSSQLLREGRDNKLRNFP